jgi:hypothetical protein
LPSRPRSASDASTLYPNFPLDPSISPLSHQTSPSKPDDLDIGLPPRSSLRNSSSNTAEVDEFGGRRFVAPLMADRNVSASTCRTDILDGGSEGDGDGDGDWTLKLRKADEAHLDDL